MQVRWRGPNSVKSMGSVSEVSPPFVWFSLVEPVHLLLGDPEFLIFPLCYLFRNQLQGGSRGYQALAKIARVDFVLVQVLRLFRISANVLQRDQLNEIVILIIHRVFM